MPSLNKVVTAAMAGILSFGSVVPSAQAITKAEQLSLNYGQVKGSGLANRCPTAVGTGSINVNGKANIVDMCLEPLSWQVEEEVADKKGNVKKEFVNTKLMTRQTYSLDGISGSMEQRDGKLTFVEEDGIDYAATTVQLPGGERVPFLFSLKDIIAKGSTSGPIKEVLPGSYFNPELTQLNQDFLPTGLRDGRLGHRSFLSYWSFPRS